MDKWERLIKYTIILLLGIFLDLMVFGPLIQSAFESGLSNVITINGVTAPTKDFFDPLVLGLYQLMFHIIDITGLFGIIFGVIHYVKKFL